MQSKLETAIYKTLTYSSLFSYPLTKDEIWQYLIWEEKAKPPTKKEFMSTLSQTKIKNYKNYYYLSDQKIVDLRLLKEKYSIPKLALAQKTVELLQKIPTIKLIGISGALSMDNADKNDDIDFFIICQRNTLWLTRFLATLFLDLKNLRRKPRQKIVKDKICLNMFLEEGYLTLPTDKQNLYTAHEIAQLKPIYDKDGIYQKFLFANSWTKNYLPNAFPLTIKPLNPANHVTMQPCNYFIHCTFYILNYSLMLMQLIYMHPRRTTETINPHVLFFHPHDISKKILTAYNLNSKKQIPNSK